MNTSNWIRFKPVRARQLYTALALGLTLMGIQGCGGPQKSAQESQSTTVQSPTPTGQVPSAPIPKLTPVPGSVVGLVLGGGAPIANATVTLWAASTGEPKQLGQTQTSADGRFELRLGGGSDKDTSLYLVAKGGEPTGSAVKGDNPGNRADDGRRQQPAGHGHDQRVHDRRIGLDPQPVPRRHRDQRSPHSDCASLRGTYPTSSISPRVATAA